MSSHLKSMEEYDAFLDSLTAELLAMSDEDVLEGVDCVAVQQQKNELLAKAKKEAARKRLARSRSRVDHQQSVKSSPIPPVDIETARLKIREAMNDPNFTLAARSLSEMTDAEVLRMYEYIMKLQSKRDE